ncbi:lambda exonuclease family protein [Kistimonas asteriae]|uniref:lambda exonuclease family protein n=1 Tax=Kistimonas asteriae TaxID=517724 RepID=UPI001BABBD88|nr:lambda exonuclease family protein [Kistimonas asteriae]
MRDFYQELKKHADTFGFDPTKIEQGSPEWHRMRAGVVTASRADCLLAGKDTAKRQSYLAELVAQVCTGLIPEEINAKALNWGKDNELNAREAYSAETFSVVKSIPLIYKDDLMRFGCSPDGLLSERGLELKCPWASRTYIEFVCSDKIKPEYQKQCQFSMWVTDLEKWDFASFDPRMRTKKLQIVTIKRDEKMMRQFDTCAAEFLADMDIMLARLSTEFGTHW